mgnify:CR=1 FL=1
MDSYHTFIASFLPFWLTAASPLSSGREILYEFRTHSQGRSSRGIAPRATFREKTEIEWYSEAIVYINDRKCGFKMGNSRIIEDVE